MRIWAKIIKDNRILDDKIVENNSDDTRTHKIFSAIEEVSYAFDISRPSWLESNIKDFKRNSKVRFSQDSFVEEVSFDYLEIEVIEED